MMDALLESPAITTGVCFVVFFPAFLLAMACLMLSAKLDSKLFERLGWVFLVLSLSVVLIYFILLVLMVLN